MKYQEGGAALFYCPALLLALGGKTYGQLDTAARVRWQGQHQGHGHDEWSFHWRAGDLHLEHPNNGGVPDCKGCGAQLVFVGGADPHAVPTY